jgi:hypothetical protein
MVHALEGAPASEVSFSPWWRRHMAAAFAFPEINGQMVSVAMAPGTRSISTIENGSHASHRSLP